MAFGHPSGLISPSLCCSGIIRASPDFLRKPRGVPPLGTPARSWVCDHYWSVMITTDHLMITSGSKNEPRKSRYRYWRPYFIGICKQIPIKTALNIESCFISRRLYVHNCLGSLDICLRSSIPAQMASCLSHLALNLAFSASFSLISLRLRPAELAIRSISFGNKPVGIICFAKWFSTPLIRPEYRSLARANDTRSYLRSSDTPSHHSLLLAHSFSGRAAPLRSSCFDSSFMNLILRFIQSSSSRGARGAARPSKGFRLRRRASPICFAN